MRKLLVTMLAAVALAMGMPAAMEAREATAQEPIPGVVRVKLQRTVSGSLGASPRRAAKGKALTVGVESIDGALKKVKGQEIRRVFPCPKGREAEHARFGLDQWYEIVFDETVNPLEARRLLSEAAGVEQAHVRKPMKLFGDGPATTVDPTRLQPTATAQMPFNDPRLPAQWHYYNPGTMTSSRAGADINLFEAWKVTTGSDKVVVAVIDGGIDVNHEDLVGNLWTNPGEIPGNGIDDDGNGYVDDVHGYNFCTNEGQVAAHQHGTHVAGTIAAVNNNGIGVAGVAGGDGTPGTGVRLMSAQVFDSRSGAGFGDFPRAIVYAADMDATIGNCSWGWDEDGYYEPDVLDAVRYFTNSARSNNMSGGLLIFAAGNTGENGDFYPQCMPEVLTVAAMGHDGRVVSYSCWGDWVDVTAPGGLLDFSQYEGILSTLPDNTYGYLQGTSMAAPHVTGIAALVLSKYGSAGLTNANLRTQLETSVNDLYEVNPGLEGRYGEGYIDAAKALQWGDGSAPETPAGIEVMPAQDNITVDWIIPASSTGNVNNHIIYYSKQRFDAQSDLNSLKRVVVDTKYLSSGDRFSYELTGLDAMTTYFIALQAVDRWGNASPLSEVIETATGRGPKMVVDVNGTLSLTSDASHRVVSTPFSIGNDDEGLLKWQSFIRQRSHYLSYNNFDPVKTVPYSGRLATMAASGNSKVLVTDYVTNDYPYAIETCASMRGYIGDTDPNLPNSMAQLFTVDPETYPNGFNLTAVYIQGVHGDNAVIEVYRGPNMMSEQTLMLRDTPSWFAYFTNLSLSEQLFFEPGESFYIVVHFPTPQEELYPLGLGLSNGSPTASQAYMSTDLGKTWTLLSQVLKGSAFEDTADRSTWAIRAVSQNPDFSAMLTIDPERGQVPAGSTQSVDLVADGSKLINGTYRANVRFSTNESDTNSIVIPVTLEVKGQEPEVVFNNVVDFGNLVIGQSKTITVELFNRGYGSFCNRWGQLTSENITVTNQNFVGPTYLGSGLPARSLTSFDVTFAPVEAGSHSGQIVFTDVAGRTIKLMLQGSATEAARIAITPADGIDVGTLTVGGESKEVGFTIANEGRYPLQFYMPKYATETIDGLSAKESHRFGYSWVSNLNGATDAEYSPMPVLTDPVEVKGCFSDDGYWTPAIDLGFDFPYYGKTYSQIYIMSYGCVAFNPYLEGQIYGSLDERDYYVLNTGLISAFGSTQLQMGPESHVEYGRVDGRFVVNFRDVLATIYDKDYTPISFHMVLDPSGDIEMYYDDFDPSILFEKCTGLFVAINDFECEDPLVVTSHRIANSIWLDSDEKRTPEGERYSQFGTGTAVRFIAPKPDMIRSVAPTVGIIAPGESVEVKATVAARDDMNAGPTFTNLSIVSSDPNAPTTLVRFNAEIDGDLNAELSIAGSTLDFGEVFRTATVRKPVTVKNSGRAPMTIESATLADGNFQLEFEAPASVAPGQSKDIIVVIPTSTEGAVSDRLTVVTSVGTTTVDILGRVIGCPEIALSYNSVDETIDYGVRKPIPLTVTNPGNAPLTYTVSAGSHLLYSPQFKADSHVAYSYAASVDDRSQMREWFDIETNGLGTFNGINYYLRHDYVEVELPFEFPFYDGKYSKMYVYGPGFVSFNKRNDDAMWPEPPVEFPAGSLYSNLIAPYWGMHTMDESATGGTYWYVTDEMAVVSFTEYGNSLNVGVDFQVILRKDGTFTFNYKGHTDYAFIFNIFGVAGVANNGGTDGVVLPARTVQFGNSVNFVPVVSNVLAAGDSTELDITLNADVLAGSYDSQIAISTDIPTNPKVEIPVHLDIIGTPKPVFPEDIVIEHTIAFHETDYTDFWIMNGAQYYKEFEVSNEGSAAFNIDYVEFVPAMGIDPIWGDEIPLFTLFYYGESEDFFGNMVWSWFQYNGSSFEVGLEPARFCVPMLPNGPFNEPGEYVNRIIYHVSGLEGVSTVEHKFTYVVTEAPEIFLDRSAISITNALDEHVTTETIGIGNFGDYRLDFDYYLDLTGVGEALLDEWGGDVSPLAAAATPAAVDLAEMPLAKASVAKSEIRPMDTGHNDNVYDVPANGEYRNYLYWPAAEPSDPNFKGYTFGTADTYNEFLTATRYVGPEGGFNISAIYTLVCPYNLGGKSVRAEIVAGDVTVSEEVLGSGSYTIPTGLNFAEDQLTFMVVRLNRPVYIAEGQEFFVKIIYPAGAPRTSAVISKSETVVEGRYLAAFGSNDWVDIGAGFKDMYGSMGYVATCLETTAGEPWVRLLDETHSGSIEPGEMAEINVKISPEFAPKERGNKAVVVIHSNDPFTPVVNFPILLDRNVAPELSHEGVRHVVNEGETHLVEILINDSDGDDFAFRLDDNHPATVAAIKTVELLDPLDYGSLNEYNPEEHFWEAIGTKGGVKVTVELAPDYGHAGDYSFTLTAIDRARNEADVTVDYTVVHVNRAPTVEPIADIVINENEVSMPINLLSVFNDPDGDNLEFTVTELTGGIYSDGGIVELFRSDNSVLFRALKPGTATFRINAFDPEGYFATTKFNVTVKRAVGIDNIILDADLAVYPNPVVETLYVTLGFDASDVDFAIYNMAGALLLSETADVRSGEPHALSVGALPTGAYLLRIAAPDGRTATRLFLKD